MTAVPAKNLGVDGAGKARNVSFQAQKIPHYYEQEFLAPGTWTWPGRCNFVEVLVVGGGGGTETWIPTPTFPIAGRAGGGGVGLFRVPVSGPVPVTVGAGGTGGAAPPSPVPASYGGDGGTSAFGPMAAPIPANTVQVGGGEGSGNPTPSIPVSLKGGGKNESLGGAFGFPGLLTVSAPPQSYNGAGGAGSAGSSDTGGATLFKFGAGTPGGSPNGTYGTSRHSWTGPNSIQSSPGRANSGDAGGMSNAATSLPQMPTPAPLLPSSYTGSSGGSGIVIVRWFE